MSTDHTATLRKIRALLATAEHPNTPPEEADAAQGVANRLIAKYAVDRAMLEHGRRGTDSGQVITRTIVVDAPYADVKSRVAGAAARANRVRCISRRTSGATLQLTLVGFESGLDAFEMSYTSLLVQLVGAAKMCGHTDRNWSRGMSAGAVASERKSFMLGWAVEVTARLRESAANAAADATAEHGPGVGLVLADQESLVDAKVAELFPGLTFSRSRNAARGPAFNAGRNSGRNADIGNVRIASRVAIGR